MLQCLQRFCLEKGKDTCGNAEGGMSTEGIPLGQAFVHRASQ